MGIIDTAKDVYDIVKMGTTIDLQEKLMTLREQALTLQEENLSLKVRLAEVTRRLEERERLVFEDGLYWNRQPDGSKTGPFCPTCHDNNEKLIRLHDGRNRSCQTPWICLQCDRTFGF